VGNTINGVAGAVSYWSDPWGNTYKALRDAANGLATQLLPQLTSATLPDLTVDWFLNAYKVSFAAAIFGAVLLLIPQLLRTAQGTQSGRELFESIGLYFPVFLVGAMFGPAIGILLVNFFHALSDSLAAWGISSSVEEVNKRFTAMLSEQDPLAIAGGVPVAVLLMFLMLCGLFFVLLVLVVQLVTLYFAGVLIPLGLLWIIDPRRRSSVSGWSGCGWGSSPRTRCCSSCLGSHSTCSVGRSTSSATTPACKNSSNCSRP
jgi:hypothetical protein